MRINLTKKYIINTINMLLGFSKQITESLIDEFLSLVMINLEKEKKLKISKFGTFSIRKKKSRIGRNPKTKEEKKITERNVVLFKPSKVFKDLSIKMNKQDNAYKTISEVVEILGLKSKKGNSIPTHTIRFWEKEFKQIKPKILNGNRRYYDKKNIELLKKIHFLLKEQGMTINGVKRLLKDKESLKLDENINNSIKADNLRYKLNKISKLLKDIKNLK